MKTADREKLDVVKQSYSTRWIACVLLALVAVAASAGSARAITRDQALVGGVLNELKLELVPSDVIGGPQKYKVTKKTIKHLQELLNEGKLIVLEGDGSIKVVDDGEKVRKAPRDADKPKKRKGKAGA